MSYSSITNYNNNNNNNKVANLCAKLNNGTSNIPLRKPLSRQNSSSNVQSKIPITNPDVTKWKNKYEEVENKRKSLLTEKEKALRHANEFEKRYNDLQIKHEQLETELFEKNEEYAKLSTASKNLYKLYETLKNQYDTETGAMSSALKDASHWYKENKALKRKTLLLQDGDTVDEGVDAGEATPDADLENLNKTIKQLSTEVAELQTEVDVYKQNEFHLLEQNTKLSEDFESEKEQNKQLERDLKELKENYNQIVRVSEMMKKELQELKQSEENQRNSVINLRREADNYKKERNVLAHQSALLLHDINDNNEMFLLQEIENLKRSLEDERNKHAQEISIYQEKLEEQDTNSDIELLEERLKLTESELQDALARAEKAEEKLRAPPPPPPPPLLPPPPLPCDQPPIVPLRIKRRSRVNVLDIAETIGVQDNAGEHSKKTAVGVNEDIINAIKEGKFTLKKRKNDTKKDKDTPTAVSELLNILGSLRRAPKKRQSVVVNDDVQL